MGTLRELFKAKAEPDDLPIKPDVNFSGSLRSLSNPKTLQSLSEDQLSVLTQKQLERIFKEAKVDPEKYWHEGLDDDEKERLVKAFEKCEPRIMNLIRFENSDPKYFNSIVLQTLVHLPEKSSANMYLNKSHVALVISGLDQNSNDYFSSMMGISSNELPKLPLEITSIPNLNQQIKSFRILHELEHGNLQRQEFPENEIAGELDSDLSAFINLEGQMDPAIRDYIVSARMIGAFTNGFFADDRLALAMGEDRHGHSTGFLLKNMLETGDTPSAHKLEEYSKDLKDLIIQTRDQFGLVQAGEKRRIMDFGLKPTVGQLMTAMDTLLKKEAQGEAKLTPLQKEMATQFLTAADDAGFKRESTEPFTSAYRAEIDARIRQGKIQNIADGFSSAVENKNLVKSIPQFSNDLNAGKYWHDKAVKIAADAIRDGSAEEIKRALPQEMHDAWDKAIQEAYADTTLKIISKP